MRCGCSPATCPQPCRSSARHAAGKGQAAGTPGGGGGAWPGGSVQPGWAWRPAGGVTGGVQLGGTGGRPEGLTGLLERPAACPGPALGRLHTRLARHQSVGVTTSCPHLPWVEAQEGAPGRQVHGQLGVRGPQAPPLGCPQQQHQLGPTRLEGPTQAGHSEGDVTSGHPFPHVACPHLQ